MEQVSVHKPLKPIYELKGEIRVLIKHELPGQQHERSL